MNHNARTSKLTPPRPSPPRSSATCCRVWLCSPRPTKRLRDALEKAFDYRGDVTITLRDGTRVQGYVFDRLAGPTLAASCVRIIPNSAAADPRARLTIAYSDIASLTFTGRDTAAGKSWEAWVKKYLEKKAAGEKNIELQPESLD